MNRITRNFAALFLIATFSMVGALGYAWASNPGPGKAITPAAIGALAKTENLKDLASNIEARTNLGLGTAAVASTAAFDKAGEAETAKTGAETAATAKVKTEEESRKTESALRLTKTENLKDLPSPATARTNLGLGTAAVEPVSAFDKAGEAETAKTGAETAATAKVKTEEESRKTESALRLTKTENLKDLTSVSTALENIKIVQNTNTDIGKESFAANITGSANTVGGYHALKTSTVSSNSTAIGSQVLELATEPVNDTAVGVLSQSKITTGKGNTSEGVNSLLCTTCSEDTAIGNGTIQNFFVEPTTSGIRNTVLGFQSGAALSTGEANTYVGVNVGQENATGSNNVGVGKGADDTLPHPEGPATNVSNTTAIGTKAGANTEVNGGVFIGNQACQESKTEANLLCISNTATTTPLITGNFEKKELVINGSETISESVPQPAKPAEAEITVAATTAVARRSTSYEINGNAVKTKWVLKATKLKTRLITVSIQKAEGENPGEIEPITTYKAKAVGENEAEVTFTVAPAKGELLFITVMG